MDHRKPVRTCLSIAATSAILLAGATSARAQSAEAEAMFGEGESLMKQGKLAEACDAFEASNKLEPRAGTLIRLGDCREKNHQLASAWSAYKDALTRVKDPNKKKIATAKVAELDKKLSYLTVTVADGNRLDGLAIARNGQLVDPVLWNHAVPVNGGEYTIVARAPKHDDWSTTVTVPNESGKINVDVPKLEEPKKHAPPPVVTTQPPPPKHDAIPPPRVDHDDRDTGPPAPTWSGKRKAAVGLAGVTVAGVVVGALLGSSAKGKQNDAYKLCPDPMVACADAAQANDLIASGQNLALGANVAFGVAGVAAIAAGVLWFTGAPERSHGVAVAPTGTGVAITGRF
jgi:tetratricopeptide (TPR) repeat protein